MLQKAPPANLPQKEGNLDMLTEDKGFMAFTEPLYVTFGMLLKNEHEKAL